MNQGKTNAEIAERLDIATTTVYEYVCDLKKHFGANSRCEIVMQARATESVPAAGPLPLLAISARTRKILVLVRADRPIEYIATRIGITATHVSRILKDLRAELNARSNMQIIDRLVELGLLRGSKPLEQRNPLTARECEILEGLFADSTYGQIAADLGITRSNIKSRVSMLREKLNVPDTEELLRAVETRGFYHPAVPRPARVERARAKPRRPRRASGVQLTPRRLEILEALSQSPNITIAKLAMQFDLQPTTVAAHLVAINRRFGVPKRDEALRAAYDLGLVKRPGPKPKRDAAGLSERHKSVLKAFAAGHSRSQIVAEMDLSPGSINRLGREAIALLGATSQADAAAIAKGRGLI